MLLEPSYRKKTNELFGQPNSFPNIPKLTWAWICSNVQVLLRPGMTHVFHFACQFQEIYSGPLEKDSEVQGKFSGKMLWLDCVCHGHRSRCWWVGCKYLESIFATHLSCHALAMPGAFWMKLRAFFFWTNFFPSLYTRELRQMWSLSPNSWILNFPTSFIFF